MPSDPSSPSTNGPDGSADAPDVHTIHVRFAPAQGPRLRRPTPPPFAPLWTERPLLMERADGSYDLIGTADRLDSLVQWVLSHGADATVQAPEALRRRVAGEAEEIAQTYDIDGLHGDGR